MSAVADRGYIQAQLDAAEKARKRLVKSATQVFGEQRGREVLKRVAARASRRMRQEYPEVFSDKAK